MKQEMEVLRTHKIVGTITFIIKSRQHCHKKLLLRDQISNNFHRGIEMYIIIKRATPLNWAFDTLRPIFLSFTCTQPTIMFRIRVRRNWLEA